MKKVILISFLLLWFGIGIIFAECEFDHPEIPWDCSSLTIITPCPSPNETTYCSLTFSYCVRKFDEAGITYYDIKLNSYDYIIDNCECYTPIEANIIKWIFEHESTPQKTFALWADTCITTLRSYTESCWNIINYGIGQQCVSCPGNEACCRHYYEICTQKRCISNCNLGVKVISIYTTAFEYPYEPCDAPCTSWCDKFNIHDVLNFEKIVFQDNWKQNLNVTHDKDLFTIQGLEQGTYKIQMFDYTGQILIKSIIQQAFNNNELSIDLSKLSNGILFYTIEKPNGVLLFGKFDISR